MAIVVSENKFIDKLKRLGKGGLGKSMRDSMNWFKNKVKEIQENCVVNWKIKGD